MDLPTTTTTEVETHVGVDTLRDWLTELQGHADRASRAGNHAIAAGLDTAVVILKVKINAQRSGS